MFQTLYSSYTSYRWLRIICALSLLICGALFIMLFGGFPPLAWRLLAHVIATLSDLWAVRGLLIVLPFIGLSLQSFLLLVLWIAWMLACIKIIQYEWETLQGRRHFIQEVQEAEQQFVQTTSLPAQSSTFDALPDTVYPRMPSSVRRYSAPTVPIQPAVTSSSPIPARASAHGVAVHEPLQTPAASYQSNTLYADNVLHDEDASDEFDEYDDALEEFDDCESFSDEFDEEQASIEEIDTKPCREALQEQPQMRLVVGIESHPGLVRKNSPNEDSALALQDTHVTEAGTVPVGLFVVADGMGGHSNGQEASRLAICSVSEVVTPMLPNAKAQEELCEDLLKDGVQCANFTICQHNQQNFTMGTTVTAVLVFGSTAYVANVGDSRTYLYRASDGLAQITCDHSHVWQLFREGRIKHEDIYTHPKRNEIYRCLGERVRVEIDSFQVSLQVNDVLLLCSDGLWEMVRDSEIEQIIQDNAPHASQTSAKLIEAALRNGGTDNVSAVVVCINA